MKRYTRRFFTAFGLGGLLLIFTSLHDEATAAAHGAALADAVKTPNLKIAPEIQDVLEQMVELLKANRGELEQVPEEARSAVIEAWRNALSSMGLTEEELDHWIGRLKEAAGWA